MGSVLPGLSRLRVSRPVLSGMHALRRIVVSAHPRQGRAVVRLAHEVVERELVHRDAHRLAWPHTPRPCVRDRRRRKQRQIVQRARGRDGTVAVDRQLENHHSPHVRAPRELRIAGSAAQRTQKQWASGGAPPRRPGAVQAVTTARFGRTRQNRLRLSSLHAPLSISNRRTSQSVSGPGANVQPFTLATTAGARRAGPTTGSAPTIRPLPSVVTRTTTTPSVRAARASAGYASPALARTRGAARRHVSRESPHEIEVAVLASAASGRDRRTVSGLFVAGRRLGLG